MIRCLAIALPFALLATPMNRLFLAAALALLTLQAIAQQPPPPPDQALITEWQGKALQEQHVAERVEALIAAFRQQRAELTASEAQKAELLEWLKTSQAKEAK
jgi:hypothetical protein